MKVKLLLILWGSLFFVIGLSSYIYTVLQEREHFQLIDSAIASHTELLAQSEFVDLFDFNPLDIEELVQDVLGGYRAGLFLVLRDNNGEILYSNQNIRMLDFDPDWTIDWQTFDENKNIFRLYSRELPNRRIMQVGLLVNKNYFRSGFSPTSLLVFLGLWLSISFIIAYVLSARLFRPIETLASEISYLTYNLDVEHLEKALSSIKPKAHSLNPLRWKDEFESLKKSFLGLLKQVSTAIRLNSANSARLIHEVNTPLTILRNKVTNLSGTQPEAVKNIVTDIDSLADFVRRYLQWSETSYNPVTSTELYAIPIEKFVTDLVEDLKFISNNRIRVSGHSNQNIFANRHEFEHLLQNILTNAIKYSPIDKPVDIKLDDNTITVSDQGPGIPTHVMEHLGEPFNSGLKTKDVVGNGLGLAWVKAIVQKYSWKMDIKTTPAGTSFLIIFENNEET